MKPRISGSLALATMLAVCTGSAGAQVAYEELMTRCEAIKSTRACYEAIEADQAKASSPPRFRRQGGVIVIDTQATSIRLKNIESDEPDASYYTYLTFLQGPGLHVLLALYWEGAEFILIKDASAQLRRLQGFPVISPDTTRLVATSASGESGYYENLVEVWSAGPKLRREFKYAPKATEWEPKGAEWTNTSTIRVRGTCKPRTESAKPCDKFIRKAQGRWLVTDDA